MRHLPASLAALAALLLSAANSFATATLRVSGTEGVAHLGRGDLAFDFIGDGPGIDGLPFRVNAYGAHGMIDDGGIQPVLSGSGRSVTADYAGKFTVMVAWTPVKGREGDRVYGDVTISNHLMEPINGFEIALLRLKFPTPVAANDGNPNLRAYNMGGPGMLIANYGGTQPGSLVCDIEDTDASHALLMKLERGNPGDLEGTLKVMNHHDFADGGSPYPQWPIPAGGSIHFRIGLRFAGPAPDPMAVCGDLFQAFAKRYPVLDSIRNWKDRRPIAQVFFESNDTNGGLNSRKWFDASAKIDTTTPGGVKRFQKMVLDRARDAVKRMRGMNAQGVITWDLEGAQFPNATYMGDPTKLATADIGQSVAPEMAEIVDQYFKIFRDAGYKVGVTVRPQRVLLDRDAQGHVKNAWEYEDDWKENTDPPADLQAFWQHELEMKIRFARKRWGATLFYVDSNGGPSTPVSFLVMRALATEFPDCLIIPEHSSLGYYGAVAPYRQLDMLSPQNITPRAVRETYPGAPCFSVINPTIESMTRSWPQLVQEIRAGSILFFRAWYDAAELPAIKRAYAAAKK